MSLSNYTEIFQYAKQHHIMVGAFNCFNMESAQALVRAADAQNTPLIIQTYHAHVDYAGSDFMPAILEVASRHANTKIALGLDHGRSVEQAMQCIQDHYSGVMIDLSAEDYDLNVRETKRVVEAAHRKNISVEAELGEIMDADASYEKIASGYTDADVARRFVKETGIDCLAVSVGTAHGNYKYQPKINFTLLEELLQTVECPIVVHGGSGVSNEDIEKMVQMGVAKLNVGTDFFEAYRDALKEGLAVEGRDVVDVMASARDAVQRAAEEKMQILTKFRV